MTITVKFFASFREQYQKDKLIFEMADNALSAEAIFQRITEQSLPANALVAINQSYADKSTLLNSGDELGFFPPVTGG